MDMGSKESDEKLNEIIDSLAVNECCSLLYTVSEPFVKHILSRT